LGAAATDVCRDSRSSGFMGVKIGSIVADASAVGQAFEAFDRRAMEDVVKELIEPTHRAADTATNWKLTGDIFIVAVNSFIVDDVDLGTVELCGYDLFSMRSSASLVGELQFYSRN